MLKYSANEKMQEPNFIVEMSTDFSDLKLI